MPYYLFDTSATRSETLPYRDRFGWSTEKPVKHCCFDSIAAAEQVAEDITSRMGWVGPIQVIDWETDQPVEPEPKSETWIAVNKDMGAFAFQSFMTTKIYAENRPTSGPWLIAKATHKITTKSVIEEV